MKHAICSLSFKVVSMTALVVLAAGCSSASSASSSVTPTAMQFIVVTSTPEPTNTSLPVTPSSTPQPTPTSTATPTPSPTPDPNLNPFTGLTIDPANAKRIPILIKVSNSPEVRPQTGLALADVVVEHYTEGGITRFTALYHTNLPDKVGSVRSCRLIDIELPVIFGAGIVCSGTSGGTRQEIQKSISWANSGGDVRKTVWIVGDLGYFECQQAAGCKLPMYRTNVAYPPHNLFASTHNALKELDSRGLDQPTQFNSWLFTPEAPDGGKVVSSVDIPYTSGTVNWTYDAAQSSWVRSISKVPHRDTVTGKQLTSTNVAVLYVNHVQTLIVEDVGGSHSIQIQLWGDGPAQVFRDGKVYTGRWQRTGNALGLRLVDNDGKIIPFKPGNTWLEMAPLNMVVKTS